MFSFIGAIDFESECKLPCNQVHLDVQTVKKRYYDNYKGQSLIVQFDSSVEILEEKNNYNEFDLMVEVGSSLGLWIGLSALGIFDLIFDVAYNNLVRIICKI